MMPLRYRFGVYSAIKAPWQHSQNLVIGTEKIPEILYRR